jgi:gluconolactonase
MKMKLNKTLSFLVASLVAVSLASCNAAPTFLVTGEQNQPTAETSLAQVTEQINITVESRAVAFDLSQELKPVPITGSYQFTEGPATDKNGSVYFSDVNAGEIYQWSADGSVAVFKEGLNKPNGLMFDTSGNLIACEGGNGRLISIDPRGQITVLVDQYNGIRFNEPNDLWIDPEGGIYFTDPAYNSAVVQDGEHVYYLSPARTIIDRVVNDMVRPNGIIGTADGKKLYVTDHGAGKTYLYDINPNGSLSNKQLFVSVGSDGMTLDAAGNLYLTTTNQVKIYDATGFHLQDISTQENPTNVSFAGTDGQILFITARTAAYTVQMASSSITTESKPASSSAISQFTLISPEVSEGGMLPVEYTCDGARSSLALSWSGAPAGTKSFAVIMHHVASPEDVHWYWVLFDIPANITSLPKNSMGLGTLGTNSANDRTEYTPPCSKGPGAKTYTYTVYALSADPIIPVPASKVNRAVLLEAIKDITIASAALNVVYTRP